VVLAATAVLSALDRAPTAFAANAGSSTVRASESTLAAGVVSSSSDSDRTTVKQPMPNSPSGASLPDFPIRATFYYPWYPETWKVGDEVVRNTPLSGKYHSNDTNLIRRHLADMHYAGLDAAISSWWGPDHYSDNRLRAILGETTGAGLPLRWAVYYELESTGDPSTSTLVEHLKYIRSTLASNPAFLRINGRFVVFVFADDEDGCDMAARWKQANSRIGRAGYINLKVFPGYRSCAAKPDSWHQYAPALPSDSQSGNSYTISPGFWRADESAPRLARDAARWRQSVLAMVASNAPWQLVTTFNEWGEGTAIEPAAEWPSESGYGVYLDILHELLSP
jgi:hypothetical protein